MVPIESGADVKTAATAAANAISLMGSTFFD
jgi:hypothetical protein